MYKLSIHLTAQKQRHQTSKAHHYYIPSSGTSWDGLELPLFISGLTASANEPLGTEVGMSGGDPPVGTGGGGGGVDGVKGGDSLDVSFCGVVHEGPLEDSSWVDRPL